MTTEHVAWIGADAVVSIPPDETSDEKTPTYSALFSVPSLGDVITQIVATFPVQSATFLFGANERLAAVQHARNPQGDLVSAVLWHGAPLFRTMLNVRLRVACAAAPTPPRARLKIVYDVWPDALASSFMEKARPLLVSAPSVSALLVHHPDGSTTLHGAEGKTIRWWEHPLVRRLPISAPAARRRAPLSTIKEEVNEAPTEAPTTPSGETPAGETATDNETPDGETATDNE
uniref:Uncharacterized protein n=1 Tax=Marseillevirus LCMAC103 TaxID=2506604 RepID=A0A481YV17_9VIRU|nr:MAG: hypothetical protein LCMAC103_03820 [Marseillevirus LCMAC103]